MPRLHLKINKVFVYLYILFIAIFLSLIINFYNDEKENENHENRIYLQTIANIKSSEIKQWLNERLSDAKYLHSNEYLNETLPRFIKLPTKTDSLKIAKSIESMYKNHDYKNILIINKENESILSMNPKREEVYNDNSANSAVKNNKITFSNFYINSLDSSVDLDIYIPIFSNEGSATIIIMKIDPYKLIFPIIQDWVVQSSSGESFLVYKEVDSVVFINKVKFKNSKPLSFKLPVSSKDLPASMAVKGFQGIVEGTDYRGEKVLADIRPVENTPWFLVTKLDLPEIYVPASNRLSFILLFLFPVFVVAGLSFLYFHSRHNYKDLLKINESTKKFEALYQTSNDAILIIENGRIINCNRRTEDIFRTSKSNILSKSILDFSPDIQPGGISSIEKLSVIMNSTEKGKPQLMEWFFNCNGKESYCDINFSPLIIENKNFIVAIIRDITEHKQAEQELNESEGRYRSLFVNNHSVMLLIDPDSGQIIDANPAACRFYGYSSEEITLFKIIDINQLGNEEVFKEMQRAREEKRNQFFFRHKLANGEIHDVEVYSGPIFFYGKTLLYSIVHDITDRRHAEEALKESLAFHTTLSQTIPFGMQIVDMQGKILFANENLHRLIPEDIRGHKCWEVYKDDKKQCHDCPLHNPGPVGTTSMVEVEGVAGGRIFQIYHTAMIYKSEPALLEIFRDITEHKRSEETIKKLSAGIEQSPVTIVITDIKGNIEYVNPKFTEITGYTFAEIKGKNPRILKSGRMTQEEYKDLWKTILSKKDWRGELLNKKKSGEEYWESALISPISNKRGEIINFIAIKEDITEAKEAEESLKKITNDLIQHNKNLEQFTYIVSHNLRAPVANIIGISDALQNVSLADNEKSIMMQGLFSSVKKLDEIIRDLNNVLQIKHAVSEKKELVRFSELLKDIESSISNLIKNEEVEIKSDFIEADEILTIKSYIYSIFYNLISNSIKYRQLEIKPIIEIQSRKLENKIELIFKDNGLGIDLQKKGDQVFGLYKRFHNHIEGKGLGLFMTKIQVETLGGKISLDSELNKGTEFKIEFDV